MASFLIEDKNKALISARIASVVSGLFALYLFDGWVRIMMSPEIEAGNPNLNVELFGYVFTDVWLGLLLLTSLSVFWTWRVFTGNGVISCVLMAFFYGEPVLSYLRAGEFSFAILSQFIFVFVIIVFGLRGTISYRRLPPVPARDVFD